MVVRARAATGRFSSPTGPAASAPPARSCRPCGSAPPPTARGSSVNASSRRAGSRIQSPRSSSESSWPGPQPAWPTNARPRRSPARRPRARRRSPSTPMSSNAISAASVGSSNSASTISAEGCTGPPMNSGSSRSTQLLELRHRLADRRLRRPVEHQPERALVGVLDDQHDRAPEVRIQQRRARRSAAGRVRSPSGHVVRTPALGHYPPFVLSRRLAPSRRCASIARPYGLSRLGLARRGRVPASSAITSNRSTADADLRRHPAALVLPPHAYLSAGAPRLNVTFIVRAPSLREPLRLLRASRPFEAAPVLLVGTCCLGTLANTVRARLTAPASARESPS